ncbi:unnamed protein product, partial [Sphacelaria rigidula]
LTVSARTKDDGTGRRAERGRLSTLIDQLKDEIDFHATAKRDMDLELKRVRQRHRFMEDRAAEEKSKVTAAEGRIAKLQVKIRAMTEENRVLSDENKKLHQILQQLQDSGFPLPKPNPVAVGQQQQQQQQQHQHNTSGNSSPPNKKDVGGGGGSSNVNAGNNASTTTSNSQTGKAAGGGAGSGGAGVGTGGMPSKNLSGSTTGKQITQGQPS